MNARNSPSRHFRQNSGRTISFRKMPRQRKVFWCLRIQAFNEDHGSHRFFQMLTKQVLFSVQGTGYTVKEFFNYVQKNQKANAQPPAKYFEQLYNNYADAIIFEKVEEQIMRNNPTYRYLLKEYYEGILLFEIMEKEVWNKASEDSVGQHTYYKNHLADYQAGRARQNHDLLVKFQRFSRSTARTC